MVFNAYETAFWFTVFIVASAASLARSVADGSRDRGWTLFCRSVSSGAIAFGVIGCWVGRTGVPDSSSPVYYVAVAALLGALQKDAQKYLLERIIYKVFNIPVSATAIEVKHPSAHERDTNAIENVKRSDEAQDP